MDSENSPHSPEEYERLYLPQLETAYNEAVRQVQAFPYTSSSGEINAFFNVLQQWLSYFQAYQPLSQYLLDAGLPQMSKRLPVITQECQRTINIYNQMYQNTLAHEQQRGLILSQAHDECMNIVKSAIDYRQEVFNNRPKFPA